MKDSKFNSRQVERFLQNSGLNFASVCFHNDFVSKSFHQEERFDVTHQQVSDWFKRFFPSNQNQYLFRLMECECTQSIEI